MCPFHVADAHCDFLYGMVNSRYNIIKKAPLQNMCLEELKAGNVALQFFAAWIDTKLKIKPLQQCMNMIDAYYRMLEQNEIFMPLSHGFMPDSGKIATVLTIEGGEAIEGNLVNLRLFHRLGVRAMALTWNETNDISGAAMQRKNKGLTKFGRDVVREMERIGMAVDVSHLSDAGIDDVLEQTSAPIFASHSNCRAVFDNQRNVQDRHIREIAKRGGVVCTNFYNKQLCDKETACIDDVIKHIEHVVEIGGMHCVGIGSDFDGMRVYPEDLNHSGELQELCNALLRHGYSEDDVKHIAYNNLHDYIMKFI